jgi:hypothetical protein
MGAHTLGGAKKSSSGHSGYWTKGEKTWFDEKYYANMVDRSIEWKNVVSYVDNLNILFKSSKFLENTHKIAVCKK